MNIIMNEMNKIWKSKVTEEHIEKRLDKFLADIFPDKSRSYISKLIKDEFVLCNSNTAKASYRLKSVSYTHLTLPTSDLV